MSETYSPKFSLALGTGVEIAVDKRIIFEPCINICKHVGSENIPFLSRISSHPDTHIPAGDIKFSIDSILGSVRHIREVITRCGLEKFFGHDANNAEAVLRGKLLTAGLELDSGKIETAAADLHGIGDLWDRYSVAVEDILLRGLSPKEILEEQQKDTLDLKRMKGAFNYLLSEERDHLEKRDAYRGLEKKNITVDLDVDKIEKDLNGREINAPTGFVTNFNLNETRNDFSDRIYAKNVTFRARVDGDFFETEIVDDGKGMYPEHLDENHPENIKMREEYKQSGSGRCTYYIFSEGASGDAGDSKKSSGIGLSNFDKRLVSIPSAELRVVTRRRRVDDETAEVTYVETEFILKNGEIHTSTSECANLEDKKFSEITSKTGTIFTLRLPLQDKK